jgi:hypothetical protein
VQVSARLVYDDLAICGTWHEHRVYGPVWCPRGVPPLWRPYTHGHWVYTDDWGWLWVSDWRWGYVPFHYGRWVWDPPLGWVWVPGTQWGPAWVTWRRGGGYVGWAPLPPEVAWSVEVGIRIGPRDLECIPHAGWCFVSDRHFLEPMHRRAIAPSQNTTIINVTQNVTNIVNVRGHAVNRGVSPDEAARMTGRPVPRARVRDVRTPAEFHRAPRGGDEVPVFRPLREMGPQDFSPPRSGRPAPAQAAPVGRDLSPTPPARRVTPRRPEPPARLWPGCLEAARPMVGRPADGGRTPTLSPEPETHRATEEREPPRRPVEGPPAPLVPRSAPASLPRGAPTDPRRPREDERDPEDGEPHDRRPGPGPQVERPRQGPVPLMTRPRFDGRDSPRLGSGRWTERERDDQGPGDQPRPRDRRRTSDKE